MLNHCDCGWYIKFSDLFLKSDQAKRTETDSSKLLMIPHIIITSACRLAILISLAHLLKLSSLSGILVLYFLIFAMQWHLSLNEKRYVIALCTECWGRVRCREGRLFVVMRFMATAIDTNTWTGNHQYRGQANSFGCDITNTQDTIILGVVCFSH